MVRGLPRVAFMYPVPHMHVKSVPPHLAQAAPGNMVDGVLVGPSALGDTFVAITYGRNGQVVHHDRAPLANITFPISVPFTGLAQ